MEVNDTQRIPASERKSVVLFMDKLQNIKLFRRGLQGLFSWKRVFFGVGVRMNEIKG